MSVNANTSFNPMLTSNFVGSFPLQSEGFVQGNMMPDPAYRYNITTGFLASTETLPMYGGVALQVNVAAAMTAGNAQIQGGSVQRALTTSAINAFSVGNQAYNGIITPGNQSAPSVGSGQSVQFLPLGSGGRLMVACSAALAASITNGTTPINSQVSWDAQSSMLVPYAPAYAANTITGATWASGQITFTVSTSPVGVLTAGDQIEVSGISPTGYNGSWTVVSVTATTIVVTGPATTPGTYVSGGVVAAGGGALNVNVLRVNAGNSFIISNVSGVPTWVGNSNAALIQLI